MKFLRLDLIKFGVFTDARIDLSDGHEGLHIVYGPNEAGKSTALRALRQWLYGIPHRSDDNFLHPHQSLRIGGVLRRADGTRLACIRRKGTRNTLRGDDDTTVIDEARLLSMLPGMDAEAFQTRFAIDHEQLRAGGRAIVEGGGDIGGVLFAAGAGIAQVGAVRRGLNEAAEELFKPNGSKPPINRGLHDLKEWRRQIRQAQLPSAEWQRLQAALDAATAANAQAQQELSAKSAEKGRLERMAEAAPLVAQRAPLMVRLAQLAGVPLLADDFADTWRAADTALNVARRAVDDAQAALATIDKSIEQLAAPQDVLDHAAAIKGLHTELGSHQKARNDRVGLVRERKQREQEARDILRDLGRAGEDLGVAARLRPAVDRRLRIVNLGSQHQALVERCDESTEHAAELRRQLDAREAALDAARESPDAEPLRTALRRAQQHGDLDARCAAAADDVASRRQQAALELEKLPLWSGTLMELEHLSVPSAETIDLFESQLATAEVEMDRVTAQLDELEADAIELDRQIEQIRIKQDVPTEEDLAEARRLRDEAWQRIRDALQERAAASGLNEAIVDYERRVDAADRIADRLYREAEQVTQMAELLARRTETSRRSKLIETKRTAGDEALAAAQQAWLAAWQPLGMAPLSPREMRSWCGRQAALAALAEGLRRAEAQCDDLDGHRRKLREPLSQCLRDLVGEPAPDGDSLSAVVEQAETVRAEIEQVERQRDEVARERSQLTESLAKAEQQAAAAAQRLADWRGQWAEALQELELSGRTLPSEANAVLERVEQLVRTLNDADKIRDRIAGIDDDAKRFADKVRRLTERIAPELASADVDRSVEQLNDRLTAARQAEARRGQLAEQRRVEGARRNDARQAMREAEESLATMCREAECTSPGALPEMIRDSAERGRLERERQSIDTQLARLAGGMPLGEFIDTAAAEDADRMQPTIEALGADIEQLSEQRSRLSEEIGGLRAQVAAVEGGSPDAANARATYEQCAAGVRRDAEEYIRLRLAAAVLRGAVARYRDKNQAPVLTRASELFSELTLGSFGGVRPDFDLKGEAVLVGVRPDGQPVAVDGMSDGTCDQLYLALRLASLETFLDGHDEPIPFVVDDTLIKFDDDRLAAALKALARLSERTQVIYFTHHEHLVELARENLDDDVLFTHRLDGRQTASPVDASADAVAAERAG